MSATDLASSSVRRLAANTRWALGAAWTARSRLVLGLGGVTVVRGLVPASLALVMRNLIDAGVAAANSENPSLAPFFRWLALGLALTVAEALTRFLDQFFLRRLQDDVDIYATGRLMEHAARLEVAFFEDPASQDVIQRAQQNTARNVSLFLGDLSNVVNHLVQTLSLAAVVIVIEPLVLALLGPLAAAHLAFQWRLARRQYLDERERTQRRRWTAYFLQLLTGRESVPEVRLLRLAPVLIRRFRTLVTSFRDLNRRRYLKSLVGGSVFAVLTSAVFFAMFARVVLRAAEGALTIGDMALFGMAGLRLRSALETVVSSLSSAMGRTLYIANLREFLEVKPGARPSVGVVPAGSRGEVRFENVTFTYPGGDRPVLEDVDLVVRPGEIVALVGENGAGKTTLVKLLARFYDPDRGRVAFDGEDVKTLSLDYLHRRLGFVFQDFGRYEGTAHENVAFGDWERLLEDPEEVERVAAEAGVHDLLAKLPEGYRTQLGRRFGAFDLSRGQWQQVAIARALARNASVLILDEPTSNLDARAEYEIFLRSKALARGRTTILISHRFATVQMADRIAVLDRGRIIETGTHAELVSRGGHYAKLFSLQRLQIEGEAEIARGRGS